MIRPPAVAGRFYPNNATQLAEDIDDLLSGIDALEQTPKAIIVPHAGYQFSGRVAAAAYATLAPAVETIRRVVLLGPSHHVFLNGIAVTTAEYFATPFGPVRIDTECCRQLAEMPQVDWVDIAHQREHSLEVHLPFLQCVLDEFSLVPLVVGDCPPPKVAAVLEQIWGDDETLIVVSTDLSHYHSYDMARRLDQVTSDRIMGFDFNNIHPQDACGSFPMNGLLYAAKQRNLPIMTLDLKNSGDSAGSKEQVVGYGAYALFDK